MSWTTDTLKVVEEFLSGEFYDEDELAEWDILSEAIATALLGCPFIEARRHDLPTLDQVLEALSEDADLSHDAVEAAEHLTRESTSATYGFLSDDSLENANEQRAELYLLLTRWLEDQA